ncbi:hypothetical protein NDU88_000827 [Pleurodeles waltl]|uniref:Uncharacterized protein n=1 Tax=Pleurodeles waltl TaxID=8319 RepID=A0AAV7L7Y5_PLEWA|nr:hypothetical protein NDU88_000827 [Pleurodeles waltl]
MHPRPHRPLARPPTRPPFGRSRGRGTSGCGPSGPGRIPPVGIGLFGCATTPATGRSLLGRGLVFGPVPPLTSTGTPELRISSSASDGTKAPLESRLGPQQDHMR